MPWIVVWKKDGALGYKDYDIFEERGSSTFWCLQEADKRYHWPDFGETPVDLNDEVSTNSLIAYSTTHRVPLDLQRGTITLCPDFNFHKWAHVGIEDYQETVEKISAAGNQEALSRKVGWIGALTGQFGVRHKMMELGSQRPDLFDFDSMNWIPSHGKRLDATMFRSFEDLVKTYGILIDVEGRGYSGRFKFLMFSKRPLLFVDRPFHEYFFDRLVPWVHFVPVKRDLSDLIEHTEWIHANPDKAREIAMNAYDFARVHLTREACFARWNEIIQQINQTTRGPPTVLE